MRGFKENHFSVGERTARAQPISGADNLKSLLLRDPDAALQLLMPRLGQMHAGLRLGVEREHEAKAVGQGSKFLRIKNTSVMQIMIEAILYATGAYWWGRANAAKVQLRRNDVRIPRLPKV